MLCTEGFGAVQQVGNTGREQRQMYLKHPLPWNQGSAVPSGGAGWDIKEDDKDVVGVGAILQQEVTLTQKISSSSSLFFLFHLSAAPGNHCVFQRRVPGSEERNC